MICAKIKRNLSQIESIFVCVEDCHFLDDLIRGNYRLIKKIVHGSFGRIYIAEDFLTPKKYAIKL